MAPDHQCWAGKRARREGGTGAGGRWACLHSLHLPRRQRSNLHRAVDRSSGRSCLVRRESQWVLYRSTGTGRLDGDGALFHRASPEQVRLNHPTSRGETETAETASNKICTIGTKTGRGTLLVSYLRSMSTPYQPGRVALMRTESHLVFVISILNLPQ